MPQNHLKILILIIITLACKPQVATDLSAIVSADGRNAAGLLPMRQYHSRVVDVAPEVKPLIEDAMRLTYVAVECYGEDSSALFALLEDATRYSAASLKRLGSKLLVPPQTLSDVAAHSPASEMIQRAMKHLKPGSTGYHEIAPETCRIIGDHTLSASSFVMLMADPSQDFATKQIIWLAARGRSDGDISQFSGVFYTFLREHLGARPS